MRLERKKNCGRRKLFLQLLIEFMHFQRLKNMLINLIIEEVQARGGGGEERWRLLINFSFSHIFFIASGLFRKLTLLLCIIISFALFLDAGRYWRAGH